MRPLPPIEAGDETQGEPWGIESNARDRTARRPGPVRRLLGYARRLLPLGSVRGRCTSSDRLTASDKAASTERRPTDYPDDRTPR